MKAEVTAKLKYFRAAPRKVRLVADLIRGKSVQKAKEQLAFLNKKSTEAVSKLLTSAIANAKHNLKVKEEDNLFIKKITVDGGPAFKRFRPVSRGSAHQIKKKTSHIEITLAEK
jgi:large subunit ribosomal protein L22